MPIQFTFSTSFLSLSSIFLAVAALVDSEATMALVSSRVMGGRSAVSIVT